MKCKYCNTQMELVEIGLKGMIRVIPWAIFDCPNCDTNVEILGNFRDTQYYWQHAEKTRTIMKGK